jgi:hypothetical protein
MISVMPKPVIAEIAALTMMPMAAADDRSGEFDHERRADVPGAISCDLWDKPMPRLAALDQLNRVLYVRSFSRVGFVAGSESTVDHLADTKMLTSITTSQFTERLIYLMLVDGHYRVYLSRLPSAPPNALDWNCSLRPRTASLPHIEDSLAQVETGRHRA